MINTQFLNFLLKARLNAYAGGVENGKILPDGSIEFNFLENELRFKDTYKVSENENFSGIEWIYFKGKAVWEMKYSGRLTANFEKKLQVFDFLRHALQKASIQNPFRGPPEFEEGSMTYINKVEGDLKKFQGIEKIFDNGILVHVVEYKGSSKI